MFYIYNLFRIDSLLTQSSCFLILPRKLLQTTLCESTHVCDSEINSREQERGPWERGCSEITRGMAEISWIYPPRFPKMKNNIKIKTYIKCIHRPAYAYDRPHLNPSDPPLLICVHRYASTFVSPLPSSSFISHHLPLFATIWIELPLFLFISSHLPSSAFI